MTVSSTYPSLADPEGSDALVAAAGWVQGTMLGTVATTVAVIAVASVGLLMLNGRIGWRRGATVVTGCFLFGASSIVAGIVAMAGGGIDAPPIPADVPLPVARSSPVATAPYDPYAGASVRP